MTRSPVTNPSLTYADDEFLNAVAHGVDGRPPTTTEVAELVGCSITTAHNRCHQLAKEGHLVGHPVGDVVLWTLAGDVPTEGDGDEDGDGCLRCGGPIDTGLYVEVEGPPESGAPPTVAGSVCRSCATRIARSLGFDWTGADTGGDR